jgi:lipopolysaccharide/colanic/teichoic acid biosynthesis glycosyltransferase
LRRKPIRAYWHVGKRLLDIAIVLAAAPVALLIVGLFAPLIMLDGGSPFFSQERVGRRGRVFRMLKLRSMVKDAEGRLEAYLAADPERRREWDESQKLRHDPRITRVGRFMRKSSIDELPQLWNVLKGEMSIVGPRPMMPSQRSLYPGTAYYALRPGITGLWQIKARNASSFADRGAYDARYFRTLSLKTDLRIILQTAAVVLHGTGC